MSDDLRYILSPQYSIPSVEQVLNSYSNFKDLPEELEQLKNNEVFFLRNVKGTQFLINPTIKIFLDAFLEPTTLSAVVNSFANQAKTSPDQILHVMETFFQRLVSRKILVKEEDANALKSIVKKETFTKSKYQVGDQIDNYKIINEISIRKSTQLYLGQQNESGDFVVVKLLILPQELKASSKKKSLQKFQQEFSLMSELPPHPNVCRLIDYNKERNYAILEYIEGKSLKRTIEAGTADFTKRLKIIDQVLTALAFVQEQNIVHGDIHLSNFLVTDSFHVKLIDFGLSNHSSPDENEVIRNGGVYECIPPERAKEQGGFGFLKKTSDFRSEVFQCGVLLFYILYKKYPFYGFTWKKLAQSIIHDQLDFPQKTNENDPIPTFILELLNKSLQKDPMDRFENVGKMLLYFKENSAIEIPD